MTVWATSVIEQDEYPTDTGGGAFTTKMPAGLLPAMHPQQPALADYPLPQFMINFAIAQAATGAAISIF